MKQIRHSRLNITRFLQNGRSKVQIIQTAEWKRCVKKQDGRLVIGRESEDKRKEAGGWRRAKIIKMW